MTATFDFNLLVDLEALLQEGSVAGAARRLHLSAPAMSRRLARLRDAFGDPLFVPAGRGLVPTARALALRPRVQAAIDAARGVLQGAPVDFPRLERTFTLRANDGFAGSWAARLSAALRAEAPGVVLRLQPRAGRDPEALGSGEVDLELTAETAPHPGVLRERLFEASLVGVVRQGHPLLAGRGKDPIEAAELVAWPHIATASHRRSATTLDEALAQQGLVRKVVLVAPGFQAALSMAMASDLVAVMPAQFAQWAMPWLAVQTFALPVALPGVVVDGCWHVRQDADPVHAWLRSHVKAACASSS